MKFPGVLFLITAIVCFLFIVKQLYTGVPIGGTFWIAVFWLFMGIYLFKYPPGKKHNKELE